MPEIDFDGKIWTRPADHMKAGVEHRVPLSDRAMVILHEMKERRFGDFIFAGQKDDKSVSDTALMKALRLAAPEGVVPHREHLSRDQNHLCPICRMPQTLRPLGTVGRRGALSLQQESGSRRRQRGAGPREFYADVCGVRLHLRLSGGVRPNPWMGSYAAHLAAL